MSVNSKLMIMKKKLLNDSADFETTLVEEVQVEEGDTK